LPGSKTVQDEQAKNTPHGQVAQNAEHEEEQTIGTVAGESVKDRDDGKAGWQQHRDRHDRPSGHEEELEAHRGGGLGAQVV
jgi:hypothetical protein